MADRPIIFSAPMIRALLAGRKSQTRRILKPQPPQWQAMVIDITPPIFCEEEGGWGQFETIWSGPLVPGMCEPDREEWRPLKGLRFAAGDRLWVREACAVVHDRVECREGHEEDRAFGPRVDVGWRSPIFMPRWASRLTLAVTDVRVERLNDISEADAEAEGVEPICDHGVGNQHLHSIAYAQLWDRLHGDGAWRLNPWICAVSFTVHRSNIDAIPPDQDPARTGSGSSAPGQHRETTR